MSSEALNSSEAVDTDKMGGQLNHEGANQNESRPMQDSGQVHGKRRRKRAQGVAKVKSGCKTCKVSILTSIAYRNWRVSLHEGIFS